MNENVYLGQSEGVSKRLGHLFRVNRKAKKMSVRVLSELTGIHPGAIIKFELGKTDMTVSRVFKIIGVLGISFDDIKILFLTSK
jgi:transcriptional regulator with XRE-family HTH domain